MVDRGTLAPHHAESSCQSPGPGLREQTVKGWEWGGQADVWQSPSNQRMGTEKKGEGREGFSRLHAVCDTSQEGKLRPGERRNKASGLEVCKPGSKFLPHLNKQGELSRKHWAQGGVLERGADGLPIHSPSGKALGQFLYLPLSQFPHL